MEYGELISRAILEKGYLIENGNIKRANDFVDEREIYFRDSDKGFFRLLLSESQRLFPPSSFSFFYFFFINFFIYF